MFKGAIIEDIKSFNETKKILAILNVIFIVLIAVSNPTYNLWIITSIGIFGLMIVVGLLSSPTNKLAGLMGQRKIEIDKDKIVVKSKLGNTLETYLIDSFQAVNFDLPFRNNAGHIDEGISEDGTNNRASVELVSGKSTLSFDFLIGSHYMANQLKKVCRNWD